MKKLERRAVICLTLAALLLAGTIIFLSRFASDGGKWATFYGNQSLYKNGHITRGAVYDINGEVLLKNTSEGPEYNSDPAIRASTVQLVGDVDGNVSSSVMGTMRDRLIGYNKLTGIYKLSEKSDDIKLTIDADISRTAYEALGNRNGLVSIYNYKTGEILCMVSRPSFDPLNPPQVAPDDSSGIYINKCISSSMTPGSTFKTVTAAAAIETVDDIDSFTYNCPGRKMYGNEPLKCLHVHGQVDFYTALSKSCNGAFAEIGQEVGSKNMNRYVDKLGLTKSYDIDGIKTKPGSFEFPEDVPLHMGWACAGQYKDLVNPCSMMVYMGAIANKGKPAEPRLIHSMVSVPSKTERMLEPSTAKELSEMMKNNVEFYGSDRFSGLDIYAKTGTAEVREGESSNSWFTGFINNPGYPLAFVVCVEQGGYGIDAAADVTNTVLQSAINK